MDGHKYHRYLNYSEAFTTVDDAAQQITFHGWLTQEGPAGGDDACLGSITHGRITISATEINPTPGTPFQYLATLDVLLTHPEDDGGTGASIVTITAEDGVMSTPPTFNLATSEPRLVIT